MVNMASFIVADALARARGEGRGAALRDAWPALLFTQSPVGLAIALALANRNRAVPSPPPPLPSQGTRDYGHGLGIRGQQMLGGLIGPPAQPRAGQGGAVSHAPRGEAFFPSFLGYKPKQARAVAEQMKINIVEPDEETLEHSRGSVKEQIPAPGTRWRDDMTTVSLVFSG